MRILVLGKYGQVGYELSHLLKPFGEVVACGREEINLADPDTMREGIHSVTPDVIVNAAAYTAVDRAEEEMEQAYAINTEAPGVIAEEAEKLGAWLIHYSTDYVFDGKKGSPYFEKDKPNPLNVYGASKLAGEEAIKAVGGKYLILRTSWVYGCRGSNFLLTMLKLAKERDRLSIIDDQVGAPTWSRMIAETTEKIVEKLSDGFEKSGIYHLTSLGQTSWCGFARAIFDYGDEVPKVSPIPSEEYPQKALRPRFSVLSNEKLQKTFQLTLPSWQESLSACMEEYGQDHG